MFNILSKCGGYICSISAGVYLVNAFTGERTLLERAGNLAVFATMGAVAATVLCGDE